MKENTRADLSETPDWNSGLKFTWLMAREDFIAFSRRESFKSHIVRTDGVVH
jgi:hypothetical protein